MQRVRCIPGKLFVILLTAAPCVGQAAAAPCADAVYRQFDFWLGEWEVRTADGELAGRNHISTSQRGCLLEERWTGAGGGTGSSMNFYDPVAGRWRQVWVSAGSQIDISGGLEEDGMLLSGSITYPARGETYPFRGLWTPLADGRVRQLFEEQRDGEWQVWFEGFYGKTVE